MMTALLWLTAAALSRQWGTIGTFTTVADKRINESSGVGASVLRPGHLFTHNDSGDSARFFEFDSQGKVEAEYRVSNAQAFDWEDMEICEIGAKSYVYLADIGDNGGIRKQVVVYRVPEPLAGSRTISADLTIRLTYPDKPHNAEALVVEPGTGNLTIITKTSKGPSQIFWLAAPRKSGTFRLKQIGTLQIDSFIDQGKLITSASAAPDGKHVAVRTYFGTQEFAVNKSFNDWFRSKPLSVPTSFQGQAEAICYSRDGRSLISTAEGSPCSVFMGKLRGEK
jgi:hypothetical protein